MTKCEISGKSAESDKRQTLNFDVVPIIGALLVEGMYSRLKYGTSITFSPKSTVHPRPTWGKAHPYT